jgi:hypothetical protein
VEVVREQHALQEALRGRRRKHGYDLAVAGLVHHHDAGVDELRLDGRRGVELLSQLVGRPEVVVVEKGDPLPTCCLDARVSRPCLALPNLVTHHPEPVTGQALHRPPGVVVGTVVDDHHLELDPTLAQRRRESVRREQLGPVTGRYDHRDGGL